MLDVRWVEQEKLNGWAGQVTRNYYKLELNRGWLECALELASPPLLTLLVLMQQYLDTYLY
jgi:hypothetical protein